MDATETLNLLISRISASLEQLIGLLFNCAFFKGCAYADVRDFIEKQWRFHCTEVQQIRVANFDIFYWLPLITCASLTLTVIHKV